MRLSAADIRRYPRFAYYVRVNVPEVIHVPVIVRTIGLYGQLNRQQFDAALRWRHGPSIVVTPNLMCNGRRADGCFRSSSPHQIEIDQQIVEAFERGRGVSRTPRGSRRVFLAGVVLLHELTHWADNRDGADYPGEEGNLFEQAVYGGFVPPP